MCTCQWCRNGVEGASFCLNRAVNGYLDADALTRSRNNHLGEEVTARLRGEWGKLGEWSYSGTLRDRTGLRL
jgi:hypothetical protein